MHRPGPRGAYARLNAALRGAFFGLVLGLGSLALLAACAPTQGYIEIAWALIDEGGTPLYPDGEFPNTCDFTGLFKPEPIGETEVMPQEVPAILRVELTICDPTCEGGCDDPTCQIVDPKSFACNSARAQMTVPSSADNDKYRFETHIVAELKGDQSCTCRLTSACALLPGPRERQVQGGLVTDLQVYQVVLALDEPRSATIDLTECCELPPSCT